MSQPARRRGFYELSRILSAAIGFIPACVRAGVSSVFHYPANDTLKKVTVYFAAKFTNGNNSFRRSCLASGPLFLPTYF